MTIGVLLSGGSSRRLGTDKALLVVEGQTLAQRSADVLRSVCGPHCVEVGPGHSDLVTVREDPPGSGPLSALLAGVDALQRPDDPVVVLACDLPYVSAPVLHALLAVGGDGAVPEWEGRPQYLCAVYGPRVVAEARARHAAGERSLRWVDDSGVVFVAQAQWRTAAPTGVLRDIDTPTDAAALGVDLPGADPSRP